MRIPIISLQNPENSSLIVSHFLHKVHKRPRPPPLALGFSDALTHIAVINAATAAVPGTKLPRPRPRNSDRPAVFINFPGKSEISATPPDNFIVPRGAGGGGGGVRRALVRRGGP